MPNYLIRKYEELKQNYVNALETNIKTITNPAPEIPDYQKNIDYSSYNSDIEDKFRADHNYEGLADYLSHFRMPDPMSQDQYDKEIYEIRLYGRQYDGMLRKANKDQKNAISFLESFDGGNLVNMSGLKNGYSDDFLEANGSLGKKAVTVPLGTFGAISPTVLSNPNALTSFANLGTYGDDASTVSIKFNRKKTNYAFPALYENKKSSAVGLLSALADPVSLGLNLIGVNNTPSFLSKVADLLNKDEDQDQFDAFCEAYQYNKQDIADMVGQDNVSWTEDGMVVNVQKSNLKGLKLLMDINNWKNETGRNADDVYYSSYGVNKDVISEDQNLLASQIDNLSKIFNDAQNKKDELLNSIGAGESIVSTEILPYMNEYQMRQLSMAEQGIISRDEAKDAIDADNAIYANLLLGGEFSRYDIYSNYGKKPKDAELALMGNEQKAALKEYIRNAITEKRVTWRAGFSNGEYGTYLTVAASDNKGILEYVSDFLDSDNISSRQGMTMFIPGLFTKTVQTAFDNSTEGKAVREINSMQIYGYDYKLPDGSVISEVKNEGAVLRDGVTGEYRGISREEAQNRINEAIAIEDASRGIFNKMHYNSGELRENFDTESEAKKVALAFGNNFYQGSHMAIDDVWTNDESKIASWQAEANNYDDYKRQQIEKMKEEIMNNIYKLLRQK